MHSSLRLLMVAQSTNYEETGEDTVALPSTVITGRSNVMEDVSFFTRPVQIYTTKWSQTATLNAQFNPWQLFMENKRVCNRVNNHNMFASKLCLKFLINGNTFFYGRAMASYIPLFGYDTMTAATSSWFDNIQLSQLPKIFLDPTTSQGGVLKLPFMYHKDYASLPDDEYSELGTVFIRGLTSLYHANEVVVTEALDITVLAWLEDSEFTVPTHSNMSGLVAQSVDEYDSKTPGPVSGPATAVSNIAAKLTSVPVLAPYAVATQLASGAIASIAKLFGFSAPTEPNPPSQYTPRAVQSLAVCDQAMQTNKLTVDSKQELTISPTLAGLGTEDPLAIHTIAKTESLMYSFPWSQTQTNGNMIYNWLVTPSTARISTIGGKVITFMPAIAGAMLPFQMWTGTIKYRIQIIASGHHRGRIAVAYDPNGSPASLEINTVETEIIDIADTRDFEVTVSNCQPYGMLLKNPMPTAFDSDLHGTSALGNINGANGSVSLWVMTELTTPNPAATFADAYINVYVSAGDDFKVGEPSRDYVSYVMKPQSKDDDFETDLIQREGAPVSLEIKSTNNSDISRMYCGETIASFRQLIKRFQFHESLLFVEGAAGSFSIIYSFIRNWFPYYRGNVNGAIDLTAGAAPYNYCGTTLLNYLAPAFQGMRGSIRHKVVVRPYHYRTPVPSTYTTCQQYVARVMRHEQLSGIGYVNGVTTTATGSGAKTDVKRLGIESAKGYETSMGTALTMSDVNPVLEFEVPFYNTERFVPGKPQDWTGASQYGGYTFEIEGMIAEGAIDDYVAAGEDFSVFFFTGWPRVFYEGSAPPA